MCFRRKTKSNWSSVFSMMDPLRRRLKLTHCANWNGTKMMELPNLCLLLVWLSWRRAAEEMLWLLELWTLPLASSSWRRASSSSLASSLLPAELLLTEPTSMTFRASTASSVWKDTNCLLLVKKYLFRCLLKLCHCLVYVKSLIKNNSLKIQIQINLLKVLQKFI